MDVREHTAGRDSDTSKELVKLLVVAHGERDVTRDDAGFLVVAGRVASELENLSRHVLKDGSQVNWGARTDARGVPAELHVSVHASHWELQAGLRRAGSCLLL